MGGTQERELRVDETMDPVSAELRQAAHTIGSSASQYGYPSRADPSREGSPCMTPQAVL